MEDNQGQTQALPAPRYAGQFVEDWTDVRHGSILEGIPQEQPCWYNVSHPGHTRIHGLRGVRGPKSDQIGGFRT